VKCKHSTCTGGAGADGFLKMPTVISSPGEHVAKCGWNGAACECFCWGVLTKRPAKARQSTPLLSDLLGKLDDTPAPTPAPTRAWISSPDDDSARVAPKRHISVRLGCKPGQFALGDSHPLRRSHCTLCPNVSACARVPCDAVHVTFSFAKCCQGKYQEKSSQNTCKDCPEGKYQPTSGHRSSGHRSCIVMPTHSPTVAPTKTKITYPPSPSWVARATFPPTKRPTVFPTPAPTVYPTPAPTHESKHQQKMDWAARNCGPGRYMVSWSGHLMYQCSDCPAGKYQKSKGWLVCLPCSLHSYQADDGKAGCLQCPTGRLSIPSRRICCSESTYGNEHCDGTAQFPCPSGKFKDPYTFGTCVTVLSSSMLTGVVLVGTSCVDCDVGKYRGHQDSGPKCQKCPISKFQDKRGGRDCKSCGQARLNDNLLRGVSDEQARERVARSHQCSDL